MIENKLDMDTLACDVKILTSSEIKILEQSSIKPNFTEQDMMYQAAFGIAEFVAEHLFHKAKAHILAGPGNNGGDGFALGYILFNQFNIPFNLYYDQSVLRDGASAYFLSQLQELTPHSLHPLEKFVTSPDVKNQRGILVDALFGASTNLNPLEGIYYSAIEKANSLSNFLKISIDIPSGIECNTGIVRGIAFKSNYTIAIESLKPAHLLLPGKDYAGKISVHHIGLSQNNRPSHMLLNVPSLWEKELQEAYVHRSSDHKYKSGHLFIFGSYEMPGAARLAAKAAHYMGCGLISILCLQKAYDIFAKAEPDYLLKPYTNLDDLLTYFEDKKPDAIVIGPGQTPNSELKEIVISLLKMEIPILLDAGALLCFEEDPLTLLNLLHENALLTPHEGEFNKIFQTLLKEAIQESKIEKAQIIRSHLKKGTIIYKGSDSLIFNNNQTIINANAPAYLATAGSGDILAGCICTLMAKKIPAIKAGSCGTWLCGKAAQNLGRGLIASELPLALRELLIPFHKLIRG